MAYKLKPVSMSNEQYEKELVEFENDEVKRHKSKLKDLRSIWLEEVKQ